MTDEFPTLEVALAACVLWLAFRGFWLVLGVARFDTAVEALVRAERERPAGRRRRRGPAAIWLYELTQLARQARESGAPDWAERVKERGARLRTKLRSSAARDLVVSAVLGGCLVSARAAGFASSPWFFGLGGAATLLLLLAVAARLRLAEKLPNAASRLAEAVSPVSAPPGREGCRRCGSTEIASVVAADLGAALRALGVDQIGICQRCGNVAGRAHLARDR